MRKPKLKGSLYGYLGHFKQDKFVQQGHNDSPWPTEEEERTFRREEESMEKEAFDAADAERDQKVRHDLREVAEDFRRDSIEGDVEVEREVKTGNIERASRWKRPPR